MILVVSVSIKFKSNTSAEIIKNLNGEIFYTKRVKDVNTLFKSDANLKNETQIYSHLGKGKDNYGGYNDNIIDFYYDIEDKTIDFVAMNNGEWSLFTLKQGENTPVLKQALSMLETTDYLKTKTATLEVVKKEGSLFVFNDNKEVCVKKFIGIFDEKFTGYTPIGFSPDGKSLLYYSMEHITPIGSIIGGMITGANGNVYIMDLSSGKNTRYINLSQVQWIAK